MLTELHLNKTGKVSDKWSSYLPYYDSLFQGLREHPVKLLEIGVQNGGSLDTWSRYFPAATAIVGCDINEKCSALTYEDPRVAVVVGNANSVPVHQRIAAYGAYDIIIDDGSHTSPDILMSFLGYFPLLRPGGVYVVEDTHALYMPAWGGGIANPHSALAFFKRLTDVVNYEFWDHELTLADAFKDLLNFVPTFLQEGWVESVEFRNSMVCIRKAPAPGHNKIGTRLVRGEEAMVFPACLNEDGATHPFRSSPPARE